MFQPTAKVLADSVSEAGNRLTTMEVTGHRFILAEFNTHRVFSRNSASSRAIPYAKMREKALSQTAYPLQWPAEQRGMQGGAALSEHVQQASRAIWDSAVKATVEYADQLHDLGVHKSVINRLLEPFLPHTIIVTATEWDGFWAQRCHADAQPEIHQLALTMKQAYDLSDPRLIGHGGWHLPLAPSATEVIESFGDHITMGEIQGIQRQASVARCARVSYLTHDGRRDIVEDIRLYHRLTEHKPMHASPLEHVASPGQPGRGNFRGWVQLREIVEDEQAAER